MDVIERRRIVFRTRESTSGGGRGGKSRVEVSVKGSTTGQPIFRAWRLFSDRFLSFNLNDVVVSDQRT